MTVARRVAALLISSLLAAGCGPTPSIGPTGQPSGGPVVEPGPSSPAAPAFVAGAWPETGSACGVVGYQGTLGRVEALDARTVRFTLCGPDGAFLTRIAHPALGIVAVSALDSLAADPSGAASGSPGRR